MPLPETFSFKTETRPRRLKVCSRRDRDETFPDFLETETRPRPAILASGWDRDRDVFEMLQKRYSLLSFWLQTGTSYPTLCFVHLLRKTQFSISNCSTETFALFSQRLSAI